MSGEQGYLNLVEDILENGVERSDRTGTGTRSVFGRQLRFDLSDQQLPLLTTKRVYWKGVVEELFWMILGCTDANALALRGVHIWDANGTREFLDGRGLVENRQGDLGPVYGHQWRHWGVDYQSCDTDYTAQGHDQLRGCIDLLKNEPDSRRIVMSAWNVGDLQKMALPPCHVLCQFYAHEQRLSCQLFLRSADVGLGLPFNIASYALLTHLVAASVNMTASELVISLGDAHIYLNHIESLREQIRRVPRPCPRVRLPQKDIDSVTAQDVELLNYDPYPALPMQMAV